MKRPTSSRKLERVPSGSRTGDCFPDPQYVPERRVTSSTVCTRTVEEVSICENRRFHAMPSPPEGVGTVDGLIHRLYFNIDLVMTF